MNAAVKSVLIVTNWILIIESKCRTRLPTLAELQKQYASELKEGTQDRLTIYKSYNVDKETKPSSSSRISITQRQSTDRGVNIPDIFVPDPLNVTPSSIANVEKVLLHYPGD